MHLAYVLLHVPQASESTPVTFADGDRAAVIGRRAAGCFIEVMDLAPVPNHVCLAGKGHGAVLCRTAIRSSMLVLVPATKDFRQQMRRQGEIYDLGAETGLTCGRGSG